MNGSGDSLKYLETVLDSGPGGAARANDLTGLLLHGFGATAGDLLPLAPAIGVIRRWYAPEAPVPIAIDGTVFGRAWFPREERELLRALQGEYFFDLAGLDPPGLTEAAEAVRSFIADRGLDLSRVVVIGFSQGAMVAAEMLRQGLARERGEEPFPAAVVLLSGALVAAARWSGISAGPRAPVGTLPPVLQAHGRQDGILPFREGEALRDTLTEAGFPLQWHPFEGDHTVPAEIVPQIGEFLIKTIKNSP